MSSNAQSALGTVLSINTGSVATPVYTAVTDVTELSRTATNKTADITTLASVAVETLVTLLDNGKVTVTMNRNSADAGQASIVSSFNGKTKVGYKITLPMSASQTVTGDVYTFTAIVDSLDDLSSVSPTKQIVSKCTLMITGGVTETLGS